MEAARSPPLTKGLSSLKLHDHEQSYKDRKATSLL